MHDLFGIEKGKDKNTSPVTVSKCHESSSSVGNPKIWSSCLTRDSYRLRRKCPEGCKQWQRHFWFYNFKRGALDWV